MLPEALYRLRLPDLASLRMARIDPLFWRILMARPQRRGFTLIELLIVIAIIGVLIALLLPAVQKVRESSNRSTCLNNLKQIGLALQLYHDGYHTFPAGVQGQYPPLDFTNTARSSWALYILPYIEQNAAYSQYSFPLGFGGPGCQANQPVFETNLKLYQCPSSSCSGKIRDVNWDVSGSQSSYVACFSPDGTWVEPNAPVVIDGCNNDPALNPAQKKALFNCNIQRNINTITDGTSNTIIVSETLPIDPKGVWWRDFGYIYTHHRLPNTPIADDIVNGPTNPCWSTADIAARSNHPGGVNTLRADGSAGFIPNTINLQTWQALGSISGEETIEENF
jgi:prepilin-type N-terminal cleavage/methylation domain-containing protein/prepilin-type processing-associated H-X9-DG protein